MSNLQHLSDVQVLLLAARFISDVNVESLQVLAAERRDVLTQDIIYRLLLTLYPADEAARTALLALLQSIRTDLDNVSGLDAAVDVSPVVRLSPEAAAHEASQLQLIPYQRGAFTHSDDPLAIFLVSWAHHVQSGAASLQDLLPLFDAFSGQHEDLDDWVQTYLKPLVRLQYEFYPGDESTLDLSQLESLPGAAGVAALLQHAAARSGQAEIARDLDQVVAPWISGRPDSASWKDVNDWIFSTSAKEFVLSAKALLDWDGPHRGDDKTFQRLAQTGFAVIYSNHDSSEEHLALARAIWQRAASLTNIKPVDISSPCPTIGQTSALREISGASFLSHSLMLEENDLTRVAESSVNFLAGVLKTAEVLGSYKLNSSIPLIAKICLSGSKEQQQQELKRLLQQIPRLTNAEPEWRQVHQQVLWLRTWRPDAVSDSQPLAYLSRVSEELIETELLDALLTSGHYQTAMDIYLSTGSPPLEAAVVKDHVVAAIYSAYDNASNGNRNRGGIRRASDILLIFKPAFAESTRLTAVDHLLRATHSLSFYHLTLQHGVPFRPVNIRTQKDPLSLIEKVLEQDQKAYAKLDDLVEIGRNLVLSGAGTTSIGEDEDDDLKVFKAEHRVTFAAISSALACHDFDTAYSYITSRLLTSRHAQQSTGFVDDTSWRAAYAAGRYRPSPAASALSTQISSLSKRMELLSLALTLAPSAEPLSEILGTWRRCEEEMDSLKSTALAEERAFEVRGDGEVPGGFGLDDRERDVAETRRAMARRTGGATYEEEAPMGLFEMARGAASALGKSAFPLHATSGRDIRIQNRASWQSGEFEERSDPSQESERVRKRDMVLGTVASGMGWMLGTQPVNRPGQQQ